MGVCSVDLHCYNPVSACIVAAEPVQMCVSPASAELLLSLTLNFSRVKLFTSYLIIMCNY